MTSTLVALCIGIVIMAVGYLSVRGLPEIRRRVQLRKFAAIAMIPLILTIGFPQPFVVKPYPSSAQPYAAGSEPSPIEQAREIDRLKDKVFKLRTELAEVNEYYANLSRTMLTVTLGFLLAFIFRKNEDKEEINRTPLGLDADDK